MHDVQRAAQPFAEFRGGGDDAVVELTRLRVRMRRIDGRQHERPVIGLAALEQQHGHGADAQQFPVGEMNEPGTGARALVAFGDDQVGADRRGPTHHRLVRRIVPFHRVSRLDPVLASHLAQAYEANAGFALDALAQLVDGVVLELLQLDEHRRRSSRETTRATRRGRAPPGWPSPGRPGCRASGLRIANRTRRRFHNDASRTLVPREQLCRAPHDGEPVARADGHEVYPVYAWRAPAC